MMKSINLVYSAMAGGVIPVQWFPALAYIGSTWRACYKTFLGFIPRVSDSVHLQWVIICIHNEFKGCADAAYLRTTLWESCSSIITSRLTTMSITWFIIWENFPTLFFFVIASLSTVISQHIGFEQKILSSISCTYSTE